MKKAKRIFLIISFSSLGFIIGAIASQGQVFPAVIGLFLGWALSFFWPIINPKKYATQIKNQKEENDRLKESLTSLKDENQKQKEALNQRMTILQMKPEELNNLIKEKQNELNKLTHQKEDALKAFEELTKKQNDQENESQNRIKDLNLKIDDLSKKLDAGKKLEKLQPMLANMDKTINAKQTEIQELKKQIVSYDDQINIESYGLYTPHYSLQNSIEYANKLKEIRATQKELIRNKKAGIIFRPMLLDDSASKGRSMQLKNIKQLVRSFNVECEAAINKVTYTNMPRIETRIHRSFDQLNKLNRSNGVELSEDYLKLKMQELHLAFEYDAKKEEEKELLREERDKEREEKKAQAEIARKRKAVEKERAKQSEHFKQAQALLKEKMATVNPNDEKYQSLKNEVEQLKAKLNDLDKQTASLDYHANHATAGYVYIISNIGSFGKNIFKIGVTRRLEPLDRIRELSSASVPFKFDVHALIFSDDAYKLETNLHSYFDKQRVNKVNNRKEFFDITIEQIKNALSKYYNRTFDFHEIPEAEEYRKSLEIAKSINSEGTQPHQS